MRFIWTNELIAEEAKKYELRGDFQKYSRGAYSSAWRKGILDAVCSHMGRTGNRGVRLVYEIACHDKKMVYVGLTRSLSKRQKEHREKSKFLTNHFGKSLVLVALTDYIVAEKASKLETDYVERYRNKGYCILNRAKTGNLGKSDRYWTEERIRHEALKYTNRTDFWKNSSAAHSAARDLGCLNRVCSHMVVKKVADGHWTDENIAKEALKYTNRTDFNLNAKGCYTIASRRGILNDVCSHMPRRACHKRSNLFDSIKK